MTRSTKIITVTVTAPASTALQAAAQSLAAGQSIKFGTVAANVLTYPGESATILKWGNSGFYDPTRKEIGFIGKRDASFPYHWIVYSEATNTWSNTRAVWSSGATSGHGYDQNTIDPATGTVYHHPYNDSVVRVWNGSWSSTPAIAGSLEIIGGLTWFPGVGLTYSDGKGLRRYSGGAWSILTTTNTGSYSNISEYNSTANAMLFGVGTSFQKLASNLAITTASGIPFSMSASEGDGTCVSDPRSANLICFTRNGSRQWSAYNLNTGVASTLTRSTGTGATPQNGTPNIAATSPVTNVIHIEIPAYGVMMFVEADDNAVGNVWLYKHTGP